MKRIAATALLLTMAVAAMAQEAPKKYEIKSGIAKTVTEVMGQKSEATLFFDNYGALEASKTKAAIPGMGELEIATISKDGKTYMVNYTGKKVQETQAEESINFLALSDEVIKEYKVEELGKEMVGERECTKYSAEVSKMGQTAKLTTWVYKGLPIKSITAFGGMQITFEIVELTEDAIILPMTFDVPEF